MRAAQYNKPVIGSQTDCPRGACQGLNVGLCCWQGSSQMSFVEQKFIFLIPNYITSLLITTLVTLIMSPLGNDSGGWRKRLTASHRTGSLIYQLLKSFSVESPFWWTFIWDPNIFTFFTYMERYTSLLQIPLWPVSQSCSFQVPEHLFRPMGI